MRIVDDDEEMVRVGREEKEKERNHIIRNTT